MRNFTSQPLIRPVLERFVLTCAIALSLSACGGGGDSAPVPGSSAGVPAPAPAVGAAPAPVPAAGASLLAPDFASLEDCVSNRWILLGDQVTRKANALLPSTVRASATGQGIVNISRDGTYSYFPNLAIRLDTPAGPANGTLSGSSRGTWSISGTNFVTVETSNNITGSVSGEFGVTPLPPQIGYGNSTVTILACNPAYFEYEYALPSGRFVERLVN